MAKIETMMTEPLRMAFPNLVTPQAFKDGGAKYDLNDPKDLEAFNKASKYSVTLLIPKSDTKTFNQFVAFAKKQIQASSYPKEMKDEIEENAFNMDAKNKNAIIKDGDALNARAKKMKTTEYDYYKDNYVVKVSRKGSFGKPLVVGRKASGNGKAQELNAVEIQSELYPGCYVKVDISVYAYKGATPSASFQIQGGVQKWKDGERLDNRNPFDGDLCEDEEKAGFEV